METAMAIPTLEAMAGRLDGLERANQRLRLTVGLMFAGVFLVTAVTFLGRTPSRKSIETEKIVIRDKEGRVRGSFGLGKDGLPGLLLFDEKGNEQIVLNVPSDGVSNLAFAYRGHERMTLVSNYDGSSNLRFLDSAEKSTSMLFMTPESAAGLYFANGKQTATIGVEPSGHSAVFTTGPDGVENGRLGATDVTGSSLGLGSPATTQYPFEPGSLVAIPEVRSLPFTPHPSRSRRAPRAMTPLVLPN
jgi:hypothetical protein